MKNKNVGLLIISVSVLIGVIIYLFNKTLDKIVAESCTHGTTCTMYTTLNFMTWVSIVIMGFIMLVGFYIMLFVKDNNVTSKKFKINKKDYSNILSELSKYEKMVFEIVIDSNGSIYQSSLVSKTALTKVKITRILDKLEGQNLIERKRRGMTNIVLLKHV